MQQRHGHQQLCLRTREPHVVRQRVDQVLDLVRHPCGETSVLPWVVAQSRTRSVFCRGEPSGERYRSVTVRVRFLDAPPHRVLPRDRCPVLWHHAENLPADGNRMPAMTL
ncbi:hypothetical protein GCM10010199_06870 [Dactylosporangium roseum]